MDTSKLPEKLQNSRLTPSNYNPSSKFLYSDSIVVMINGTPIIAVGEKGCELSLREANAIVNDKEICKILALAFECEFDKSSFSIQTINSSKLVSENKQFSAIAKKERGVIEVGGEYGDLVWIVLSGNNSLPLATALSISPNVDFIVYELGE